MCHLKLIINICQPLNLKYQNADKKAKWFKTGSTDKF
jgi:hypothetical protein